MTTLADLLRALADHVRGWWPFTVLDPWEQGVKLLFGRVVLECNAQNGIRGTGVHWSYPFVGRIIASECNVEVFETEPQTVRTADGLDVTFTLGVQVKIDRLALYFQNVNDELKPTVGDTTRTAAAELARTATLADMAKASWPDELTKLAQTRMHGWGVKIRRVGFVTFTTAPTLRLITGRSAVNDLPGDFIV